MEARPAEPLALDYVVDAEGQIRLRTDESPEQILSLFGGVPHVDLLFLYPPVGAQRVNMGRALWEKDARFREAMLQCDAVAKPLLPQPLVEVLYPDPCEESMYEEVIHTAQYALPCLFAFQFALTRLWEAASAEPTYVVGHSLGEFMAAVVAGVLTMPQAMLLVCERANLMHATVSSGAMMAVRASADVVRRAIEAAGCEGVAVVAAENSADSTSVSGDWTILSRVLKSLPAGTKTSRVKASHADHSPMMGAVASQLRAKAAAICAAAPPRRAAVLWVSTVTGAAVADDAAHPAYWERQALEPVRFIDAVHSVLELHQAAQQRADGPWAPFSISRKCLGIEMGHGMLCTFCDSISQQRKYEDVEFLSTLKHTKTASAEELHHSVHETIEKVMESKRAERLQMTLLAPFLPVA